MSTQQTLVQFFSAKIFIIPQYQRSYAWDVQNARDLFLDIKEAFETNADHYIGTIVLARTAKRGTYCIVDGQQRLTTIVMLISAIISKLKNKKDKEFYRRSYVKDGDVYKLTPLERDKKFFIQILDGKLDSEPENKSQRFMRDVYHVISKLIDEDIPEPVNFLKAIESLSILEFIEERESDAIRIFLTVNDRGRELSKMDKMKSLLFYYSNKYLEGRFDSEINDKFAEIFELYDDIKMTGEDQKINVISSKQFTEDDLLRHHHICFSEDSYDPTGQQVLDDVKSNLSKKRKDKNPTVSLDLYIKGYLESLTTYVRAFAKIIKRTETDPEYYKIFSILGLSVVYYPVITQFEKSNLLSTPLQSKNITILKMIELIDVRVFKIRAYAGKKHSAEFAYSLNATKLTLEKIEKHLLWFNSHEISDDRFKDYLTNYDYFTQPGLLRAIFIDYCERINKRNFSLPELKNRMNSEPTIEHILSQTPKFKPKAFKFRDNEDFDGFKNLIGNLTVLEKKINSRIKNSDLVDKIPGYDESKFLMTKKLASSLDINKRFDKNDLIARSKQLVDDFSVRWWA